MWSTYRIPGVNAKLVGMFDERQRLLLIQDPVLPLLATITHCTQDDLGDLQAGVSKAVIVSISASWAVWEISERGFYTGRIPWCRSLFELKEMNRISVKKLSVTTFIFGFILLYTQMTSNVPMRVCIGRTYCNHHLFENFRRIDQRWQKCQKLNCAIDIKQNNWVKAFSKNINIPFLGQRSICREYQAQWV